MIETYQDPTLWVVVAVLGLCTLALVWLSLTFAAAENAVSRVTRASLNNLVLQTRTDSELTQFSQMRRLERITRVQHMIVDRYATAGSCAFFRIACNVLDGVLVMTICSLFGAPLWVELVTGVVVALIIGIISVLIRPSSTGTNPADTMIRHAKLVQVACVLTPFARAGRGAAQRRLAREAQLSDDEELERLQREQGKAMIDRLVESNGFDKEVSEMMRNVLKLSDTLTREIMVPRTDMLCIHKDTSLHEFLQLCSRSGFSRVPVIGDDVDDLVGVAFLKDAVRATAFNPQAGSREVSTIAREPMLVPESKPVDDLFHLMQRTRQHIAVVVDEYGGIAGVVTIEDTLEQIVGELEDEHDRTQHSDPVQLGDKRWSMPARTPIATLEELFEIDIDEDDVDTVYGLLTKLLGQVPIVGSSAQTRGLKLTAVDSAGRRKKVSTIVVEPASVEESSNTSHQETEENSETQTSADRNNHE